MAPFVATAAIETLAQWRHAARWLGALDIFRMFVLRAPAHVPRARTSHGALCVALLAADAEALGECRLEALESVLPRCGVGAGSRAWLQLPSKLTSSGGRLASRDARGAD